MVDLSTYRCRIGRFHRRVRWTVDAGKRNFDAATIETIGAVCFIGLLLFCSGIELNPGPTHVDKECTKSVMSSQQQGSASMEMSLPCLDSGQDVGLLENSNAAEGFSEQQQQEEQQQFLAQASMQAESPPGQRFVTSKCTQGVQPRIIQQETGLEINPELPPAQIHNGCPFPKKTEQINNTCQPDKSMPDVKNFITGEEKSDMTSKNRKYDGVRLPEELTDLYSSICLRNDAFQEEASCIVQDDSEDSRSALDAEPENIRNESETQNIGSTKIYDKIEKEQLKLLILHEVLPIIPTNQDEEEIKQDYDEEIKCMKESKSIETVFDRLLDTAVKCKNKETGQVMYEVLLELKPNFVDECVVKVHENQCKCVWNEKEIVKLRKITELQLLYDDKPSVAPHSAVTYLPFPPALDKDIAAKNANCHYQNAKAASVPPERKSRDFKRSTFKIRLGYVSSDLRDHPMSHLISKVFELHDRNLFEVYIYALNKDDKSVFRQRIENGADAFHDISTSTFESIQKLIIENEIDILVNLNGYTRGAMNEIFALKLCPVQVMYLGYPGTSGSDYMDYFITDFVSTILDNADDFSEKLAYLPTTHFLGNHLEMFAHLIEKIEIRLTSGDYCLYSIIINGRDMQPLRDACQNSGFTIKGDKEHGEYVDIPYIFELTSKSCLSYLFERFLPNFIKCFIWNHLRNKVLRMREKLTIFGVDILNGLIIGKDEEHKKWSTGEIVPEPLIFTARSQYGLPDDKVVFANFNQNYKYDKVAANMWIQILRKVPNSVLWLLRFDRDAEVNFREYTRKSGEDIADGRIVTSDPVGKEEYIRRAQLADVFLDTPLCNGHTTCMDAIFAGLPVVTLPGRKLASRIAASIVKELGCEELIAKNEEDYVNIAVQLGNDPSYLKGMKNKVFTRRRESSLFDVQKKVKWLEVLYKLMYRDRLNNLYKHITELVSDELKAIPPRENVMQQGITVLLAEDHLSPQESG